MSVPPPSPRDFGTATLLRSPRSLASALGTTLLFLALMTQHLPFPLGWILIATSLGAYVTSLVEHHRRVRTKTQGALGIDDREGSWLTLGGRPLFPLQQLHHAFVSDRAGETSATSVVLTQKGMLRGSFELQLSSQAQVDALLQALNKSTDKVAARFRVLVRDGWKRTVLYTSLALLVFVLMNMAMWRSNTLLVFWFMSAPFTLVATLLRREVRVGSDGVATADGRMFVPYSALERVTQKNHTVSLHRRSGRPIRLQASEPSGDTAANEAASRALFLRIEERRAAWVGRGEPELVPYLARGDRSTAAWLSAVRSLGESAASFRTMALPSETLLRMAEDPRAAPSVRAGAAASLAGHLDAEGIARVRIAAEVCAAPNLRRVLAVTADQRNDEIESALAGIEDDAALETRHPKAERASS